MKKVLFLIIVTFITTNSFSSPKGQALAQSMGQFGSSLSGLGAAMMARQYENVPHLTNFDLAVPKFTDNEQNIIFTRGFFLNNSGDFYIAGNAVDSTAFLSELGFTDFLEKRDKFKKMNDFLGWTSQILGLARLCRRGEDQGRGERRDSRAPAHDQHAACRSRCLPRAQEGDVRMGVRPGGGRLHSL